jgi:CRISPR/Cas system-associated protein Csm6/Txe/YoeB family toxin of Txe-Axe toxin-antitoxin module
MLRQALVVGINDYPGLQNLKTPASDAERIASLLKKYGGFQIVKRLPVKEKEGLLSINENPSPYNLVTSAKLKEAIAELFNPQGNDVPDTALLYFAGHGLRQTCGGIPEGFLAASDVSPRKNIWGVSLNWLQRLLQSSPVKEQIIWLDCCYSGELLNGEFINFQEADPGERGKGRDRCFIAACGDAFVAYGNKEHGILTSLLLKGLDPQSCKIGDWINNRDLAAFIVRQLENDEKLATFPQRPLYNNSGGDIKLIQGAKQSELIVANQLQNNICPYKGLAAFEFNDEDPKYFYGRTALTDELIEKFRQGNFLAVLGASGCGKSSVVKAGLLYQLKLGQRLSGSNEWKILPVIRPGDNPLYSLAQAFTGSNSKKVLKLLENELKDNGAEGLKDFIAEDFANKSRIVLIVDQFEEVFTLCQDIEERQLFFDCLLGAVENSENKFCLAITIRADFVGECAAYPKLAKQIQQDLVTVTPMTTEELTEAIKEPASKVGLGVEESLVTQMIADVQKSLGSLPLLQFTLMELWDKRNINNAEITEPSFQALTLSGYRKMGGVMGALNRHAQQIYNFIDYESVSPSKKRQLQQQELIRKIFLKLVRTGETVKDTRQPQPKTKIMAIAGEDVLGQETLSQLLEELIQGRLLVTSEVDISSEQYSQHIQVIDLAHEALMSGWEDFAQWRDKYRQILRLRDRVDDAFKIWDANGRKNEDLMMGGLLAQVREKWLDLQLELDATAKEFYQRSDDYDQEQSYIQKNWRENFLDTQTANNTPNFFPQYLSSQSKLQRKIVISFTGTNLLTNQIDLNSDNQDLLKKIFSIYNYTFEEVYKYSPEALDIIDTLKERAVKKLKDGDIQTIRRISSELNFIYALYEQNLEQAKGDIHFLITSDTALGHTTSDIIREFLLKKGFNIGVYNLSGFSMVNYDAFAGGIDQLFKWFSETIPGFKEKGYKVCINLVNAPRTLQAYMDIIGMLYADELIYIFEGIKSNLINLPKIPIQINTSVIKPIEFALMEVGSIPASAVNGIPDIFVYVIDDEAIMSELGILIWKECKNILLSGDLLQFPLLDYSSSFINDYNSINNAKDKVKLHQVLAKVSYLLNNDSLRKYTGLKYQKLNLKSDIYAFRVSLDLRITYKLINGNLQLLRYVNHDDFLKGVIS